MSSTALTSSLFHPLSTLSTYGHGQSRKLCFSRKNQSLVVRAAKRPAFLGFTSTAEIWNSRACMLGLIGTFIVELILNKGILEVIGVEIGKGLDLPL